MFYLGTHIYIEVFSEWGDSIYVSLDFICYKGSFKYYVISWGGRGVPNDCASVIVTQWLCVKLITEGEGGLKSSKNWLRTMWMTPNVN